MKARKRMILPYRYPSASLSLTLPLSFIVPHPLSLRHFTSSYLAVFHPFLSQSQFSSSLSLCRSRKPKCHCVDSTLMRARTHTHSRTHTATPKHACHSVISSQISRLVVGRQLQLRQQQSGCEVLVECNMKKSL